MAEMEKLQMMKMMNLYEKLGVQMNASSKGVDASKESGEFKKLLKDKSPKPLKEPDGKVEYDSQSKNTEQSGGNEEVLTEETKIPEQMAELLVMMNAVQESVVQQPEAVIEEETLTKPFVEELSSVESMAVDGQSDHISQLQVQQSEPVIQVGQELPEEKVTQEGWGLPVATGAKENTEVQQVQNAAEQKVTGVENKVQTNKEAAAQTEPQEHSVSAAMLVKEHFVTQENQVNTDTKLVTTESTLPEDLAKTMAENIPGKNGTLTLELEPGSLGKLTIQMVYEEGKTVVSLMATNARTLEILSQRSAEIASILEDRTGEKTEILMYEPQRSDDYTDNQKEKGQQQEEGQRQNKRQENSASFLHQLRLGLI